MKTESKRFLSHDVSMEWYFAYASNLNIFQMMKRVGEWSDSTTADGYSRHGLLLLVQDTLRTHNEMLAGL
jgi:hypothetical protein